MKYECVLLWDYLYSRSISGIDTNHSYSFVKKILYKKTVSYQDKLYKMYEDLQPTWEIKKGN
ncbi:MAG: hypothetical protein ACTSW1_07665 [Candidatus Hodarchaeales archaeon]